MRTTSSLSQADQHRMIYATLGTGIVALGGALAIAVQGRDITAFGVVMPFAVVAMLVGFTVAFIAYMQELVTLERWVAGLSGLLGVAAGLVLLFGSVVSVSVMLLIACSLAATAGVLDIFVLAPTLRYTGTSLWWQVRGSGMLTLSLMLALWRPQTFPLIAAGLAILLGFAGITGVSASIRYLWVHEDRTSEH